MIYGTEKTLDAYKFNLLKTKQMFINQINNGTIAVRRIDEDAMDEDNGMNFAEFVALLSGNTDLLEKTKLDNKIMQLEKEQAIFKKDRIRAERKIAANREDMTKAESAAARMTQDWEYITSYTGDRTTRLLNLAQATAEETGRELHRISKTYRNGAIGTIGTYAGLNLSVYSEYDMGGTFYRNTFLVEGVSGLKYRCGISGALPLGFVESSRYPQAALAKLPGMIEEQRQKIAKLESEIPALQGIIARKWSKGGRVGKAQTGVQRFTASDRRKHERGGTHAVRPFRTRGHRQSGMTIIHRFNLFPLFGYNTGQGIFSPSGLPRPYPVVTESSPCTSSHSFYTTHLVFYRQAFASPPFVD